MFSEYMLFVSLINIIITNALTKMEYLCKIRDPDLWAMDWSQVPLQLALWLQMNQVLWLGLLGNCL